MRTLKLALTAFAAFAFNANAQTVTGMQVGATPPPAGMYQAPVVAGSQPDLQAFHAGGVAACDGCHVMHNASGGVAKSTAGRNSVAPWTNVTNAYLLQGGDQSSTCLICHGGVRTTGLQFTIADMTTAGAPTNRTPGGDFGWLRFGWTNSPSARHGHNVVAVDFPAFGTADPNLTVAPGGTWQGGAGLRAFACTSCHDPHGRYRMQLDASHANGIAFAGPYAGSPTTQPIAASGSYGTAPTATYAVGVYRLLGGVSYAPASNPSSPFSADPPVAVAPQTYNQTEATAEVRVSYGTGMSEWCQNCHASIHLNSYTSGVAGLKHPAGAGARLHAAQVQIYNTYVSSGNINPALTSNYTSLVPFEQGADLTLAALRLGASSTSIITAGATSNVMCLSCHRAHASAFDSMVRWDQNATFLTGATGYTTNVGGTDRTAAITAAGYYDRPVGTGGTAIGTYQRSLCNKCHAKD